MIELIIDSQGNTYTAEDRSPIKVKAIGYPGKIEFRGDKSDLQQALIGAENTVRNVTITQEPEFIEAFQDHIRSGGRLENFKYQRKFHPDAYALSASVPLDAV